MYLKICTSVAINKYARENMKYRNTSTIIIHKDTKSRRVCLRV